MPHIHHDETVLIPYSQIAGYRAGDEEAVFLWWNLVPNQGGGFEVDRIRSIVFEL